MAKECEIEDLSLYGREIGVGDAGLAPFFDFNPLGTGFAGGNSGWIPPCGLGRLGP